MNGLSQKDGISKMARVNCMAISKENGVVERGQASIEWYDENNKPQYYCRGYLDASTEEPLKTCQKCRDFLGSSFIEEDFKKFQKRLKTKKRIENIIVDKGLFND